MAAPRSTEPVSGAAGSPGASAGVPPAVALALCAAVIVGGLYFSGVLTPKQRDAGPEVARDATDRSGGGDSRRFLPGVSAGGPGGGGLSRIPRAADPRSRETPAPDAGPTRPNPAAPAPAPATTPSPGPGDGGNDERDSAAERAAEEIEERAEREHAQAEAQADAIEERAMRAAQQAEAQADQLEERAEDARERAEQAHEAGQIPDAVLAQAVAAHEMARAQAQRMREAAQAAYQAEAARAQQIRAAADRAAEQAAARARQVRAGS